MDPMLPNENTTIEENTVIMEETNQEGESMLDVTELSTTKTYPHQSTKMANGSLLDSPSPKSLDGGYGWVVVLGSFVAYLISDGWLYSFGILYPKLLEQFEEGKGKTAIIAAMLYGVPMLVSPLVSALTTIYGCRNVSVIGGLIMGVSIIWSAFASSVDILCVSTGIFTSIGLAMTYLPALVIVTYYFEKRRGLATALAVTGSGLGAFAFPPLLEHLLLIYNWFWTLMIMGAICFNIIVAGLLFRPPAMKYPLMDQTKSLNNPSKNPDGYATVLYDQQKTPGRGYNLQEDEVQYFQQQHPDSSDMCNSQTEMLPDTMKGQGIRVSGFKHVLNEMRTVIFSMLDKSLIKEYHYILFCTSGIILFIWIAVPYVYLVDKAIVLGIEEEKAVFLLSIMGIARTIGQLFLGFLGDLKWINSTGLYAACITMMGVGTLLVPFCTSYLLLCLYSVVFGFSVSVTYCLMMMVVVDMVGLQRATNAFGLMMFPWGISTMLGTPIAGWLYDATNHYDPSFYTAGGFITLSGLMLIPIPRMISRQVSQMEEPHA